MQWAKNTRTFCCIQWVIKWVSGFLVWPSGDTDLVAYVCRAAAATLHFHRYQWKWLLSVCEQGVRTAYAPQRGALLHKQPPLLFVFFTRHVFCTFTQKWNMRCLYVLNSTSGKQEMILCFWASRSFSQHLCCLDRLALGNWKRENTIHTHTTRAHRLHVHVTHTTLRYLCCRCSQ